VKKSRRDLDVEGRFHFVADVLWYYHETLPIPSKPAMIRCSLHALQSMLISS
jgi:hypothetical protein